MTVMHDDRAQPVLARQVRAFEDTLSAFKVMMEEFFPSQDAGRLAEAKQGRKGGGECSGMTKENVDE